MALTSNLHDAEAGFTGDLEAALPLSMTEDTAEDYDHFEVYQVCELEACAGIQSGPVAELFLEWDFLPDR